MIYPIRLLAALLPVTLAACVSVLPDPEPADAVYRLTSPGVSVVADPDAVVMRVDRPLAATILSGRDIVVSQNTRQLITASGARWAESIPVLVQQSVLQELGQRPVIIGVEPTSGARADYRMSLAIRNFEVNFDQGKESPPMAIVHYTATVSNASTRKLVGTYDVQKTQRANAVRVSSIVEAIDTANIAAISETADWLETLSFKS